MSGAIQLRTKCRIPEDFSLQQYCCENLKCNIVFITSVVLYAK